MLGFSAIGSEPIGAAPASSTSTPPTDGGNGGGTTGPHVTLSFVTRAGTAKANASALRWAFFDQVTPDLLTAPVARGTGAITGANGEFSIDITGTAHTSGQIGYLIVSDTTGTPGASAIAFAGPVMVT